MQEFIRPMEIRWSDMDPNFHLRHSVYYDWGALCRMQFLAEHGITMQVMQELRFGPILFREECVFRKEVRFGDQVTIDLQLIKARKDFSRWSFAHRIFKNGSELAASLTVDGAWMNVTERKLATPPSEISLVFDRIRRSDQFEWQ